MWKNTKKYIDMWKNKILYAIIGALSATVIILLVNHNKSDNTPITDTTISTTNNPAPTHFVNHLRKRSGAYQNQNTWSWLHQKQLVRILFWPFGAIQ